MAERSTTCKFCGLTAPKGHAKPYTYIEKHETNCPKNPKNK